MTEWIMVLVLITKATWGVPLKVHSMDELPNKVFETRALCEVALANANDHHRELTDLVKKDNPEKVHVLVCLGKNKYMGN